MRTKFPSLIALICLLVYVGAVLFGAHRIYSSIESKKQQGVQELDKIQFLVTQSGPAFNTEPFKDQIRRQLADSRTLQGIIITGALGNQYFEKEAGEIIRRDPSPRFIPRFGYTVLQVRHVDMPDIRNVNIYSVINTINYEQVILILKQTLIIILGALLLSFITMIITALRTRTAGLSERSLPDNEYGSDDYVNGSYANINNDDNEAGMEDDFFDDFTIPEETPNPAPKHTIAESTGDDFDIPDLPNFDNFDPDEEQTETAAGDDFDLVDFVDEDKLSLPAENSLPSEDVLPLEDSFPLEDVSAPAAASSGNPNGLYSPRSNIGWEAYTKDRLASELHRCASSEQDLVVLLTECGEGVNCDSGLYKKIAGEAVDLFNLQDLSFEYGERGITVIIPNAGLELGIAKAEEFHSRLLKNCFDSFHSKSDILTGISSRSGRLIEAERLMMEAAKALEKAKEERGSPIFAFKSDPEKYREFVRKGI